MTVLVVVYGVIMLICNKYSSNKLNSADAIQSFAVYISFFIPMHVMGLHVCLHL